MKRLWIFLFTLMIWVVQEDRMLADTSLQQRINQTAAGGTIFIDSETFAEPITIHKPITIKGNKNTVLSYTGEESFITITGTNVQLENLEIKATGLEAEEAAILLTGTGHRLSELSIRANGIGMKLNEADQVVVTESSIIGTSEGHAIQLWKSTHNLFSNNSIQEVQDGFYVEYSNHNTFKQNNIQNAHYGIHLMYSHFCLLEENESKDNFTGAMIMGTTESVVRKNAFVDNDENVNSQGLLLYDSKNVTIVENEISRNRIGVFIEKTSMNTVMNNSFQTNFIGIQFTDSKDNLVYQNNFLGNVNDAQAVRSQGNQLEENYWDASSKIDSDGDGISEVIYQADPYFLALTEEVPEYQLFFQAPGMAILQKMLRSTDGGVLMDSKPLMEPIKSTDRTYQAERSVWIISGTLLIGSLFLFILGRKQR